MKVSTSLFSRCFEFEKYSFIVIRYVPIYSHSIASNLHTIRFVSSLVVSDAKRMTTKKKETMAVMAMVKVLGQA